MVEQLPVCEIQITQALIDAYAAISGDFNPIHVDPVAGAASPFGGTIAHGCIPMEPVFQSIQRWLGEETLPPGTAIRLRYRAPSRPGDTIRSDVSISSEAHESSHRRLSLAFLCINQRGERVLDGDCELVL